MLKPFPILILSTLLFLQSISVLAQQQQNDSTIQKQQRSKTRHNLDSTTAEQKQRAKQEIKSQASELKSSVKQDLRNLNPDSTKRQEIRQNTKQTSTQILGEKASNLQYDSDNPDDAPWKKDQFSKDDLKKFDLPSKEDALPSAAGKPDEYRQKAGDLKNAEPGRLPASGKLDKVRNKADSLLERKEEIDALASQDVATVQRVYSQKFIKHLSDSLGISKADSIMQLVGPLTKVSSKEELLSKLNTPLKEKTAIEGVGYDEENGALSSDDATKLQGLSGSNLDKMQLPPEVLSELAPLKGNLMDSKYMRAIDSMRNIYMKERGYKLDEEQLTEELKKTSMEERERFWDKTYFEMVLGFMYDSSFTIVQVSPAWAYHFTDRISLGVGPNISVQFAEKKIHGMIGLRTFVKAEVWKQRAYLQVEDNMEPARIEMESFKASPHSILAGGGGLLPISKKFAINLAVFYRVNQEQVRPGGSPWVIRVGLSSIKDIGNK